MRFSSCKKKSSAIFSAHSSSFKRSSSTQGLDVCRKFVFLLFSSASNERVGFLPAIQRQHKFCSPLHGPGGAGEYRFWALSGPKRSKILYSPASPGRAPASPRIDCFSYEVANSTSSVVPCMARGARGSTGFGHFQAPSVPKPVLPRVPGPAPASPPTDCFS